MNGWFYDRLAYSPGWHSGFAPIEPIRIHTSSERLYGSRTEQIWYLRLIFRAVIFAANWLASCRPQAITIVQGAKNGGWTDTKYQRLSLLVGSTWLSKVIMYQI
jgi:hypothetical protein